MGAGWYIRRTEREKVTGDRTGRRWCYGRGCGRCGGCAGYLSVERGGIGESGWEGWRQLRRVQRVWSPHVWAAGIESGHCELICGKKKRRSGVRSATRERGSGYRERERGRWAALVEVRHSSEVASSFWLFAKPKWLQIFLKILSNFFLTFKKVEQTP